MTREEWLKERKKGIGGSDASAVLGLNPYKTNVKLWEEKTGRIEIEDISEKEFVKYGTNMEDILRQSFSIKHPEFEIKHQENTIIKHPKYPFLFASLDGILINKETGEMGILEIKTTNFHQSKQKEKWKDKHIPDNYYLQCLHYLNVTGYSFVMLFAELTYSKEYQATKTYDFNVNEEKTKTDMKYLEEKEIHFWKDFIEKDKRPPLLLPQI